MTVYAIQNQWGGNSAPWHEGGIFNIGNRAEQRPIALKIQSGDGGHSFTGTMTYQGEGPIGFRGTLIMANTYSVVNQWGGNDAPWHPGGTWVLGCRTNQGVVAIRTSGNGTEIDGTMTYQGEGPIGLELARSVQQALADA